jgi:MinD-like ATPase involved in chromosome partitioning or flagellar assembly
MSHALENLKAWVAGNEPVRSFPRRYGVEVVGAGKGGVGTSTMAALMALVGAARGERTLLIEAVPGGLPLLFGMQGEIAGIADLVRPGVGPSELLHRVGEGLDLLPSGGLGDPRDLSSSGRTLLLRRCAEIYEQYDRVVVDGGASAASVMGACEVGLQRLWIVTLPDRVAAAGAYALLKAVIGRWPTLPCSLVVNRADEEEGEAVRRVISDAAHSFLNAVPQGNVVIPPDPTLSRSVAKGVSLHDLSDGPALRAARKLFDF